MSCSHIAFPVQVPHRPRGCLVNHSHIHVQGCERPRTRRGGVTERRGRQNRCIMPSPPATAGGIGWGPRSGTGKDKLPDYRSVQASACIVLAFLARSDAECPARSVHLAANLGKQSGGCGPRLDPHLLHTVDGRKGRGGVTVAPRSRISKLRPSRKAQCSPPKWNSGLLADSIRAPLSVAPAKAKWRRAPSGEKNPSGLTAIVRGRLGLGEGSDWERITRGTWGHLSDEGRPGQARARLPRPQPGRLRRL